MRAIYDRIAELLSYRKRKQYSREYYYDRILDKYTDGQFYHNLISGLSELNAHNTISEIQQMEHKCLDDTTPQDIIRKYGKPEHKFSFNDEFEIEILFYREKLGNHKTKIEFHFHDQKLFFYNYTFSYVRQEEIAEIVQIIRDKYLNNDMLNIERDCIRDEKGNVISFLHSLDFIIRYFSTKGPVFNKVLAYVNSSRNRVIVKDRLKNRILYERL